MRPIGRLLIVGASLIAFLLSFLIRRLHYQQQSDQQDLEDISFTAVVKRDSGIPFELTGWVECHTAGRSCHFSNILHSEDGSFYLFIDRFTPAMTRWAGLMLAEGIGSPGNYYYIDSWSMMPLRRRRHLIEEKLRKRLEAEMKRYSEKCEFIAIYLVPSEEQAILVHKEPEIVHTPSMIFSVLWGQNFFRSIYAGMAAYTTARYWGAHPENLHLLATDVIFTESPVLKAMGMAPCFKRLVGDPPRLYRSLILGISSWSLLDEAIFRIQSEGQQLREQYYKEFSSLFPREVEVSTGKPLGLFVQRRGIDRSISNEAELFKALRAKFSNEINLRLVCFDDMSFERQLALVRSAKLLIAVHGAALAHILFMPKDSYVLEIFPFQFKKTIYRNLARTMGVNYMSFQVRRPSQARFSSLQASCLRSGQVNWYCNYEDAECAACKSWWRRQQLKVDSKELIKRIDLILPFESPKHKTEKYLLFMPWEQLNNQLIGFKSSCALAQYSDRTLVLPPVGYWDKRLAPPNEASSRRRKFNPRHYNWRPFERYFDVSRRLPCRIAPWDAITTLNPKLDRVLYNTIGGPHSYWRNITEWFYWETAGMSWNRIDQFPWLGRALHIPRWKVRRRLLPLLQGNMVGTGCMFYFWNFGQILPYPLKGFQDFMGNKLYRDLVLPFQKDLIQLAENLLSCSRSPLKGSAYDSAHVRRGDYRQKCREKGEGRLPTRRAMLSCHQTSRYLKSRLKLSDIDQSPIFIASNIPRKIWFAKRKVVHQSDLIHGLRISRARGLSELISLRRAWKTVLFLDSTERAILDQLLCIKAPGLFTGNYFSSFTRTISDHRQLVSTDLRIDFF